MPRPTPNTTVAPGITAARRDPALPAPPRPHVPPPAPQVPRCQACYGGEDAVTLADIGPLRVWLGEACLDATIVALTAARDAT